VNEYIHNYFFHIFLVITAVNTAEKRTIQIGHLGVKLKIVTNYKKDVFAENKVTIL